MLKKMQSIFFCFLLLIGSSAYADIKSTREILSIYSSNDLKALQAYDQIAGSWAKYQELHKMWDLEKLLKAIEFSAEKYAIQPSYIINSFQLVSCLWEVGSIRHINVLTTAVLQDVFKYTDTTDIEIESIFGSHVLQTIKEMEIFTNEIPISEQEKNMQLKQASLMSLEGQVIKLAGLISFIELLEQWPLNWTNREIEEHYKWSEELLSALNSGNNRLENNLRSRIIDYKIPGTHVICAKKLDWGEGFFNSNLFIRSVVFTLDNNTKWKISWESYTGYPQQGDIVNIIRENNNYYMMISSEKNPDKSILFFRQGELNFENT